MNDFNASDAVETGLEFLTQCEPLIEMLKGYRAKLIEAGFNETAAEMMVVDMHRKIMLG